MLTPELLLQETENEITEAYRIVSQTRPDLLTLEDQPKPDVEGYTSSHQKIYSKRAKEILKEGFGRKEEVLIIRSGMFGGKSTLSFYILDELKEKYPDKEIQILIADVMGESYVTGRSFPDRTLRKREAHRYGDTFNNSDYITPNSIVLLDEFSFLNPERVTELVQMCKKNNSLLILTGLDRNYLGTPLPIFTQLQRYIPSKYREEYCKSFVPRHNNQEPTGTSTLRYAYINGRWILDIGLLPLVVSKEESQIVHYTPGLEQDTAYNLLKQYPETLERIVKPTKELEQEQQRRLNLLRASQQTN